jgi:DNA-binding beta-propeller fold protein YncE
MALAPLLASTAPKGVAADGSGNLYVADTGNGTIRKIVLGSGIVTTVVGKAGQIGVQPGLLPASINQPVGVATLPAGEIVLVDQRENAVLLAQ